MRFAVALGMIGVAGLLVVFAVFLFDALVMFREGVAVEIEPREFRRDNHGAAPARSDIDDEGLVLISEDSKYREKSPLPGAGEPPPEEADERQAREDRKAREEKLRRLEEFERQRALAREAEVRLRPDISQTARATDLQNQGPDFFGITRPESSGGVTESSNPISGEMSIALDRMISRLVRGEIQYTAPSEVSIKGEVEIGVAIGVNTPSEELESELREHFPSVAIESDSIRVAEEMVGSIESRGFDFFPDEPVVNVVSNSAPTIWRWRGVPKEAGEHTVVITMSARLKANGVIVADRLVDTWRKKIVVKVSIWDLVWSWVLKNHQWVWGALILPALAYIGKLIRSKYFPADAQSEASPRDSS
ncbi:hypothetical protein FQZ97_265830 [compost metagenome]